MQQHWSKDKLKGQSRVEYLYRKHYRPECKREGLTGALLRQEALKRARKQYATENATVHSRTPPSEVGSNKQLLALLPPK
jgi:hypothetical protein